MPSRRHVGNGIALGLTLAYLTWMVLVSPSFRALDALRLAAEHGHFVPIVRGEPLPPYGADFLSEWFGGYLVCHGEARRLYDHPYVIRLQHDPAVVGVENDKDTYLLLFYPPGYYLLVAPLSLLPVQLAAIVWVVLMSACLIAAVALLARAVPEPRALFGGALLAAILMPATIESLNSGQKGTLWLLMFTATFLLLRRERPFAAGLVFGLLAFKPPLALAGGLVMLFKRQWPFVAGSLLGLLVVVGLSLALGMDVCADYVRSIRGAADVLLIKEYPLEAEHSTHGFFALLLRGTGASDGLVRGLSSLTGLLSLGVTLALCRGTFDFQSERFTLQFAGIVLATALLSLKLQVYDLTVLLLPVFLLARLGLLTGTEFESQRGLLLLTAVLLYGAYLVSGRLTQFIPVQISVPASFAALLVIAVVAGRRKTHPALA